MVLCRTPFQTTLLKGRIEKLSKLQGAATSTGGAKARAILYVEMMRSKARQALAEGALEHKGTLQSASADDKEASEVA